MNNRGIPGKPKSAEHRAKLAAILKGRPLSDETRRRMSKAALGRTMPPEVRAKISATRLERRIPGLIGAVNPRWKGGRYTSEGYVYVLMPLHPNADQRGYVTEHQMVMSQVLGRPIDDGETVHHDNEIRNDNIPENLKVMTRGAHASLHHKGMIKPGSLAALRGHTSEEMRRIWATTRAGDRAPAKICQHCAAPFFSRSRARKFCSQPCYRLHRYSR